MKHIDLWIREVISTNRPFRRVTWNFSGGRKMMNLVWNWSYVLLVKVPNSQKCRTKLGKVFEATL